MTESHRRPKFGQLVTPNDTHAATNSNKRHTTVEGNVAHPVAHQVELLTLTAFS